jgi:thymidylate synthase (FAD)
MTETTPEEATTVRPVNLDEIVLEPAEFRSDVKAVLVDSMGGEHSITRRARVSVQGEGSLEWDEEQQIVIPKEILDGSDIGLIKWLYRNQHGTPFEGPEFEWYFEVPVFISRQIVKHRLSSINEESGRYRTMRGQFYVVPESGERPLVQVGKTGDYKFELGRPDHLEATRWVQKNQAESAWQNYQKLSAYGIANEVARMHLPVSLYSSMYFKVNLRSLLNFLALRKDWGEDAVHPSKAQYEISLLTDQIAEVVKKKFPTVWECFVESGYQAV